MQSELPADPADAALRRQAPWWLLLVALLSLVGGLATLPLMDRDEPRFARATVEMAERGSWLIPYFNGEYRFDKPPLTYWWMQLHYGLLGEHEFAARLHATLAALLGAFVIYGFGRRLLGTQRGLLAAALWLTTFQVLIHARMGVADMPMVLAVALMLWAAWELLTPDAAPARWGRWFWIFHGAAILGFYAKGPIAWAVPALALILHRWAFHRRPLPWARLQLASGSGLVLLAVAAWGVPALLATHGEFWNVGMGKHVVARGTGAFNDRRFIPGVYYLGTALLSLFPWFLLLWGLGVQLRRQWDGRAAYLVSWLLAPYLIFSFYATQLPHYVLPGFAALALLLAGWVPPGTQLSLGARRWLWGWGILWVLACSLALTAVLVLPFPGPLAPLRWVLFCAALMVGTLLALVPIYLRGSIRTGLYVLTVFTLASTGLGFGLRALSPVVKLQPVFAKLPADTERIASGFMEPSLVFYARGPWQFGPAPEAWAAAAYRQGPRVLLWQSESHKAERALKAWWRRERLPQTVKPPPLSEVEMLALGYRHYSVQGINLAKSTWVQLEVYVRERSSP